MACFAAVLDARGGENDPAFAERLARPLAHFGQVSAVKAAGGFDAAIAVPPLGKSPAFKTSLAGICVVAMARLDARGALTAKLGADHAMAETGLLLRGYEKWNVDLVEQVHGDFAFVLWDPSARLLLAATDQFAARPLYYAETPDRLVLGTAIDALRDSGCADTALDETYLADFLTLGFPLDQERTVHRGIRKLLPGQRLIWRDGTLRVERYWVPPANQPLLMLRSREAYAEAFREIFFRAVSDRLPAAGRVGVLFSGGMDSTAVAAAARSAMGADAAAERVTAYTAVLRDGPDPERHFAPLAAAHLGLDWRGLSVEDAVTAAAPPPARWPLPEPGLTAAHSPLRTAGEEIAAAGGVLFDGLGADALFMPGGTSVAHVLRTHGLRAPAALAQHLALFGRLPSLGIRKRLRRAAPGSGAIYRRSDWMHEDLVHRTRLAERLAAHREAAQRGSGGGSIQGLAGPLWSNVVSLGAPGRTGLALESAHPFFDVRLVDFVARLPDPLRVRKAVLREALAPFLPAEIVTRPKISSGNATLTTRQDEGVQARTLSLIAEAPELSDWVDRERLAAAVRAPGSETSLGLEWPELLALWLRDRRVSGLSG